tara:strand:- start:785 stop:946 length:162 start_codon:yes stop_codon:yes gene_type:complete
MKHKGFIHKLPKKDIERHFPEKNGGKGSHARNTTVSSRKLFKSNFDSIDWSKK